MIATVIILKPQFCSYYFGDAFKGLYAISLDFSKQKTNILLTHFFQKINLCYVYIALLSISTLIS